MGWGIRGQAKRLSALQFVYNEGGKGLKAESFLFSEDGPWGIKVQAAWSMQHHFLKVIPHLSGIQWDAAEQRDRLKDENMQELLYSKVSLF